MSNLVELGHADCRGARAALAPLVRWHLRGYRERGIIQQMMFGPGGDNAGDMDLSPVGTGDTQVIQLNRSDDA
jgi:hypothetical protein